MKDLVRTEPTRFTMIFDNGYSVSVKTGSHDKCYNQLCDTPPALPGGGTESPNAELMIFDPAGNVITQEWSMDITDSVPNLEPDWIAHAFTWAASQRKIREEE